MTLPASGSISIGVISAEAGEAPTASESLGKWFDLVLPAQRPATDNMTAFYSKAYFKNTTQGNCDNGNCTNNCNCGNVQCTNCFISGPTDCINCDSQQWFQTNCNCACTYNCNYSTTATYNCNCACACSKIICTKLYEIGMMPYNIFAADQQYGEWLKKNDRTVYRGYIRWAKNVTSWIDGGGPDFMVWILNKDKRKQLQSESAKKWAYKIATPWSEHMAYLMGAVNKDNDMGRIIMKIGRPICKVVYALPKERMVPDFVATWTMWALFFFSYFTAKALTKKFSFEGVKKWMTT